MNNASDQFIPGYKQPWFWFLMVPLIMVFIMGFTMLYLSISTSDGVVVDNFYKDGLAIKTRNEQDAAAADLDKNRPAVVDAEATRFLLSRKATAAALVSDRRDVETTDEDDPTDRNVAALKAVA